MTTSARADEIAAFYTRHAARLRRIVAAHVNTSEQTIEDACQTARAILLRRDDVGLDDRGAAWLATVAIRESWRLASTARELPMGAMRPGEPEDGELPEPPACAPDAAEQAIARVEHAERVERVATWRNRSAPGLLTACACRVRW